MEDTPTGKTVRAEVPLGEYVWLCNRSEVHDTRACDLRHGVFEV